jgi:hypothetical protein
MKLTWEARQLHVQRLENALKLVLPGFAPRFTPLGTDNEERVFWALSPGIAERNATLDFIAAITSGSSETKRRDKKWREATHWQSVGGEESGVVMKQWSWFVAIWGKKPARAKNLPHTAKHDADAKEYSSEEENVRKWWAVGEPEEIRKLAEWVAIESGTDPKDDSHCSSLVKGLKEYAATLEWRLLGDRFNADTT